MKFVLRIILALLLVCSGVFAQDDVTGRTAVLETTAKTGFETGAENADRQTKAAAKPEDVAAAETGIADIASELKAEIKEEIAGDDGQRSAGLEPANEWFEHLERFQRADGDGSLRHFAPIKGIVPADEDVFTAFEPLVEREDFEPPATDRFHWRPALAQSMVFLAIQHGSRLMAQPKTRRGLKGPFFKDWGRSVKGLRGWDDGGIWFTNYIAHPLQGGVTGHIFVNNSDRARRAEFGTKIYWETRFKAFVWSALWSSQFEIGPLSEASIGNVGMTLNKKGKTGMAWVDMVVTPVAGTAELVVEDLIDKYVLENWIEKNTTSRTRIKIWRTLLNPTRSFANILRWKAPWRRDRRPF